MLLDPSTSTYRINVKTSAKFGDGFFNLDANFESSGSDKDRTVSLQGSAALHFTLATAKFDGAMKFSFRTDRSGTTASFSGNFTLDLKVYKASVDIRKLEYDSTKGGLQNLDVSGQAEAGSKFGPAELSANGGVHYSRAEDKISLDINIRVRLWRILTWDFQRKIELGKISCHSESAPRAGKSPSAFGSAGWNSAGRSPER